MDALIVVDMQNDFIDGSLGTKEAQKIVNNVAKEIKKNYGVIFVTQDTHNKNYLKTQEGINLPIEHCIKGTQGWELNETINSVLRDTRQPVFRVEKPIFGSFDLLQKIDFLKKDLDSITLVGLCTDICVISNALMIKSNFPDIPVRCVESCCAGVTPEKHKAAIEVMRSCQIEIV